MPILSALVERSGGHCECCGAAEARQPWLVAPADDGQADHHVLLCSTCEEQVSGAVPLTPQHWRGLADTLWSPVTALQVLTVRLLRRLPEEPWARDLLDQAYLDEDAQAWADAESASGTEDSVVHKDCHGAVLSEGDSVTLIKDLNVKGSSLVAKRGTAVRNIHLVPDEPGQIEGRVEGQRIVILTQFVKKSG